MTPLALALGLLALGVAHGRLASVAKAGHGDEAVAAKPAATLSKAEAVAPASKLRQASSTDACSCLNWLQEYKAGKVHCGTGAEMFTYTHGKNTHEAVPKRTMDAELCHDFPGLKNSAFFPKQDHEYCIRVNRQEELGQDSGSWCYVSGSCKKLGTFPLQGTTRRMKMCRPGDGVALGDLAPAELFKLAKEKSIDYQMIALMSYRTGMKPWMDGTPVSMLFDPKYESGVTAMTFNAPKDSKRVWYKGQLWMVHSEGYRFPTCVYGCSAPATPAPRAQLVRTADARTPAAAGRKAGEDPCRCLNWAQEYNSGRVRCGMGAELFSYTKDNKNNFESLPKKLVDVELCHDFPGLKDTAFFPKQDHRFCIRVNRHDWPGRDSGSWCYVSAECNAPASWPLAGTPRKMKHCGEGDVPLGSLPPARLFKLAEVKGIDYQMMALMAYHPAANIWNDMRSLPQNLDRRYETEAIALTFNAPGDTKRVWYKGQLWSIASDSKQAPTCLYGCTGPNF